MNSFVYNIINIIIIKHIKHDELCIKSDDLL